MKISKKIIAALFTAISVQCIFAQVSIGGVTVQNAESKRQEIETKYGKFTVKSGFPVEYYESGAVKSFYIDDFGTPTFNAELKHPDYGRIIVSTPVPQDDYMSQQSAQPLEFWENGNIKTLKLADIKYSYNEGGYFRITFEKFKESLAIFPNSKIHFYENGKIESVKVANGQSFKFLRDASVNAKNKAVFKNQSEIKFYDDGSIKEYTPQNAKITNPLNFKISNGSSVVVSRSNPTLAIGFYPALGSSIALSDTIILNCVPQQPVYFNNEGTALKQISWTFKDVNFTLGKVNFYSGLNGESVQQTVYFNDDGSVKTVSGVLTTSFDGSKSLSTYPTLIEGRAVNVRQVDYEGNGNMTMADLGRNTIELSSEKTKDGILSAKAWKIYYQDGKKVAAVGNVHLQSNKGSFYDTTSAGIILLDGNTVKNIILPKGSENISASSEIHFDQTGKAVSYTAKNLDNTVIEINIK